MNDYLDLLLALSLCANIFLGYFLYKFQKESKNKPYSTELNEFLKDMLDGDSLIRVSRVEKADLFLRSPRGK